ncbi:hypothetical protein [Natronococcus occultus]|uniref:Transcriptional regulator n=1 Tax=Natronococcus occultus SP4 TaxID=694430 RepID=L0JVI3_9EURY|nr:hypothetical protein [Natronococcus occultus]AGB36776.1 hypothetical protein Natoc_0927 [Natronococcus occultus SP4]
MIDNRTDLSGSLSADEAFELLSDGNRRELLLALLDRDLRVGTDPQLSVDTIVESGNRESELCLYHAHLPKLESVAVIDWQRERDEIRTGRRFDELRPLLELLRDHPDAVPGEFS